MDEQGFIFTTDAILALVVVIVLTSSMVTYGLLPIYQGEQHQHLEDLADSALETMDQNGTLREAAVEYTSGIKNNNTTEELLAQNTLRSSLNTLLPNTVGYSITLATYPSVTTNDSTHDPLTATDTVTKVKVISGPQQGWMARAYYKQDQVLFQNVNNTAVTTVWNFHNYLTNFAPWGTNYLYSDKFWGGTNTASNTAVPINFTVPGVLNSGKFLLGSTAGSGKTAAFGANVTINSNSFNILNSSFLYLYATAGNGPEYNVLQNLNASQLLDGLNTFDIKFNASSTQTSQAHQDMPWFSILANYTTVLSVPEGVTNTTYMFPNIAGIGTPNNYTIFNYDTGGSTFVNTGKVFSWTNIQSSEFDMSTPFEITNLPTIGDGSAVASEQNITLPAGNKLFDAYTVVNAYGGEDGAIVQVKNSMGVWNTAFSSFGSTARSDGGYGNVPGIINILPYLTVGTNEVRIITWDDVSSTDYDLAGLENCYTTITYSPFPIGWDTFPFTSYQNDSSDTKSITETQSQAFNIGAQAQSALLFVGVGGDTRSISVSIKNTTGTGPSTLLYNGTVPYVLDLAALDANASTHTITNTLANGSTVLIPGNYTLTVSVVPCLAYESGDGGSSPPTYGYSADPIIFSGTRISIIYPQWLQNIWAIGFASDPGTAALNAYNNLTNELNVSGDTSFNPSLIKNTTIFAGDVPNAIPVRLDLWTQ